MKRFLTAFFLTLVALTLLAAVAGGVVISTVNLDNYRDDITQAASKSLGRPVVLEGHISHSLFPLGLTIDRVLIRDDVIYGAEPFLAADGVSMKADLWKLLTGSLEIERVEVRMMALKLAVAATGAKNWQTLSPEKKKREGVESLQDERPKSTPENAAPDQLPLSFTVQAISIASCRISYADLREKATFRVDLGHVTLAAVGLNRDIPFNFDGAVEHDQDKRTGRFSTKGSVRVTSGGDVDLTLERAEVTFTNPDLANQQMQIFLTGGALYTNSMSTLALNDLKGRVGTTDLSGTLALILPGGGNLEPGRELDIRGEIALGHLDVDAFTASVQVLRPVRYKTRTSLSDADLVVPVVTPGKKPSLSQVNNTSGNSGTPAGTPSGGTVTPLSAGEENSPTYEDTLKSPYAGVSRITAELDVKAQSVTSGKIRLDEVQGAISADGGNITAPFLFRAMNGRTNGTMKADITALPPTWKIQADSMHVDAEKFITTFSNNGKVSGTFSSNLNLSGKELDWPSMAPHLLGTIGIALSNGTIRELLPENIAQVVGLPVDLPVSRVSATFKVKNGVAETRDISAVSTLAVATGKGKIDLVRENMLLEVGLLAGGREPTIPLVVSGALKSPSVSIDRAKAAKILTQGLGENGIPLGGEKSKELAKETGKELGKALKGLFR